jgi:hypothetical protein
MKNLTTEEKMQHKPRSSAASALRRCIAGLALAIPTISQAYVECSVNPQRYYVGDGILWVVWKEGGAGLSSQSSPDFKPILATVMTSLAGGRQMSVRYADGTSCTAGPGTIVGVWLS